MGRLPLTLNQQGTGPQLLSSRCVDLFARLRSGYSRQERFCSCYHCRRSAAARQMSSPHRTAQSLPREWNASWKQAVRSQKWAEVSCAHFFVWAWPKRFLWNLLLWKMWAIRVTLRSEGRWTVGCWGLQIFPLFGGVVLVFVNLTSPGKKI